MCLREGTSGGQWVPFIHYLINCQLATSEPSPRSYCHFSQRVLYEHVHVTLLWRFGPFSGRDLPTAGVSRQLSFYEAGTSDPQSTAQPWRARVSLFVRHLDTSLKTCPTRSYIAGGTSFEFAGARKLRHSAKYAFVKVEIQSRKPVVPYI
jgi:hypothetical protein